MSKQSNDNYDSKAEIERVERKFEPQNFAKNFCEAAQSQKNIDEVLRNIIRDLVQKDYATIDSIKELIKKCEKEELFVLVRKGLSVGWTVTIAVISGAIGYWFK